MLNRQTIKLRRINPVLLLTAMLLGLSLAGSSISVQAQQGQQPGSPPANPCNPPANPCNPPANPCNPPANPCQPPATPPANPCNPCAQPCSPGAATANPCAPAAAPTQQGNQDPYLQYAENVDVRITQIETSKYPTVQAFVSVTDMNAALIRTLQEGNFTASENGTAAANVRFGNRDELNLPLAIMFVVDISGSMENAISTEADAIRQFVGQLKPEDRVGLITFSDAAMTQVGLSADHSALLRELGNLTAWGQTALWDGIYLGMNELLADTQPARKALIVLSDGGDNKSMENPQTILSLYDNDALQQNKGFSVFTLGLGDEIDRTALGQISDKTGGTYMDSPTAEDLANVYRSILTQIQNEYLIEYDSPVESQVGQIIDLEIGLSGVKSFNPGKYTYRSPGLSKALARALWPGLIAICILTLILIFLTIYKLSRRVWLTVMLTPLEGKDYPVSEYGAHIGSAESCEIRIGRDPAILPLHASISESTNGFVIEAMNSDAPIVFSGGLVAKKVLRNGDRFVLGTTQFTFNEKNLRPGEGEAIAAQAPLAPLTQQTAASTPTAAGQPAAARRLPSALVGQSGPYAGRRFDLQQGENSIGRTEGSIQLAQDSQVSRRHCRITLTAGSATLTDEGSTNGSRLNGQPCQPGFSLEVGAGDVIALGSGQFVLD